MPNAKSPEPGEVLHFLVHGATFHQVIKGQLVGFVSKRGQEATVTAEFLDANKDRHGVLAPWLASLHDSDAQLRRFGQQIVAPGPWPKDLLLTLPGDFEHDEDRRAAVRDANAITDPVDRKRALRAVDELFGPATPTSRTNAVYAEQD